MPRITRREIVMIVVGEVLIGIPLGAAGTLAFNEVVANDLARDSAIITSLVLPTRFGVYGHNKAVDLAKRARARHERDRRR